MKRMIKASHDFRNVKVHAQGWNEFLDNLEAATGSEVDSSFRRQYDQWVIGYKDGYKYEIEVEQYSKGDFDLMSIVKVGPIGE